MSPLKGGRIVGGGRTEDRAPADPESLKKTAPVPLSPKQFREREEGKKVSRTPPGVTTTVIPGGRDVFEALGCPTYPEATEKTGMPIPRQFKTRAEEKAEEDARRRREQRVRDLEEEPPDPEAVKKRREAMHATAAKHKAERDRRAAVEARKTEALRQTLREAGL